MTGLNGSIGGLIHVSGSLGNPQSPMWLVCENSTKELDHFAVWHASGCPVCIELAETLKVTRPDDEAVEWLIGHLVKGGSAA